jgi:hypothetical protein
MIGRTVLWQRMFRQSHEWARSPVVNAVILSQRKVLENVPYSVVVLFGRASTVLGTADDGSRNIRSACHHGVYYLADSTLVRKLVLSLQSLLNRLSGITNAAVESRKPS